MIADFNSEVYSIMKVGIYGFGSIGRLIARVAIDRGHKVVSAVDINEEIVGKDIGELLGRGTMGVKVSNDPNVLSSADIVLHATGSYLDKVFDQIATVIDLGKSVVSTCETLSYPYYRYPALARRLDEKARSAGVYVIGTGVNPGFLLDALVASLSAPFNIIRGLRAIRSIDAAKRRKPFQIKIGVGMDPEEFKKELKEGKKTAHVGYAESVLLIADVGGLTLSRVEEGQEPVVAESDVESHGVKVSKGKVLGVRGYGSGYIGDREIIRVEFHAYVGGPEYEEIKVEGTEASITWKSTGTPGDLATASLIVSVAEKLETKPYKFGLLTMADLVPYRIKFMT